MAICPFVHTSTTSTCTFGRLPQTLLTALRTATLDGGCQRIGVATAAAWQIVDGFKYRGVDKIVHRTSVGCLAGNTLDHHIRIARQFALRADSYGDGNDAGKAKPATFPQRLSSPSTGIFPSRQCSSVRYLIDDRRRARAIAGQHRRCAG